MEGPEEEEGAKPGMLLFTVVQRLWEHLALGPGPAISASVYETACA